VKAGQLVDRRIVTACHPTVADAVRIQPERIVCLQYLRAAAAFCVLIFHASYYLDAVGIDGHFRGAFDRGFSDFGVYTFFAISGFLMGVQVEKRSVPASAFLLHRLVRIFPLFWMVAIAAICLRLLVKSRVEWDPLTFSLAPIGERIYPIGVEWTLVFEVSFYLYTAAIVAFGWARFVPLIGCGWLISILAVSLIFPELQEARFPHLLSLPLSAYGSAFAAGLLIPWALRRRCIGHSILPAGLVLFAGGQFSDAAALRIVSSGVGCAMIVAWSTTLSNHTSSLSRVFHSFGDWSYATYLVHVPVILAVYRLASAIAPSPFLWLAAIGITLAASAAIGPFDVTLYRRLKRAVDQLSRGKQMTFCAGFLVLTMAVVWAGSTETSATTETAELVASSLKDAPSPAAELDRVLAQHGYANSLRIVGKIDAIGSQDREFSISGWAADLDDVFTRPIVLAIHKNQVLVAIAPTLFRSDVLARLGLTHPWGPAAFVGRLAPGRCSADSPLTFVAVNLSRKKYRAIDARECPKE
jgi:exopolysaccharide production protein ExoZ